MLLGFLWNSLLIMKWESSFADHISFVWICQTDVIVCRYSRFQGNILKSHSSGQAIKTLPFSFLNLIYSQQSPGDRVQNKSSPRRVEIGNNSPFEHSFALPFFGIEMKTDLFQSCGHCWVFQICWRIEYSTFTASSFRIWNSSTGIPSPPLALFVVMLSKAHLTSHSRMSGSRSVITPSWLSGSWRSFLYSSSVYSCK